MLSPGARLGLRYTTMTDYPNILATTTSSSKSASSIFLAVTSSAEDSSATSPGSLTRLPTRPPKKPFQRVDEQYCGRCFRSRYHVPTRFEDNFLDGDQCNFAAGTLRHCGVCGSNMRDCITQISCINQFFSIKQFLRSRRCCRRRLTQQNPEPTPYYCRLAYICCSNCLLRLARCCMSL